MGIREVIIKSINFRHACKEFALDKKINDEDFEVILEAGRLSPSSFGLEPWKFLILDNPELRSEISPVCWGGQKQLASAPHFLAILARRGADMRFDSEYIARTMAEVQKSPPEVIAARQERLRQFQTEHFHLDGEEQLWGWSRRQAYIPLANMLTTAALLGIDSCPIEGFDLDKVEDILAKRGILDREHFRLVCLAAFGYRLTGPKSKTRRPASEVVEWVK